MMRRLMILLAVLLPILAAAQVAADTVAAAPVPPAESVKGRYIWVPDSMSAPVEALLQGRGEIKMHAPDAAHDLVVVDGDTISQVLRSRNLGRFDRGLYNYLFIPKGKWQVGITASYGQMSASDLKMFDILGDLDFGIEGYTVNPYISYFIKPNTSVGLRFSYTNLNGHIDNADVDFDEDLNFSLKDVRYRNESYASAFFLRQYLGLSRGGRFGIFNEVELSFGSGNSTFLRMYDSSPRATHTTYMSAGLNFSPGLTVFVMEQVSFNISLGVFGFYLRNERQKSYMLEEEAAQKYPDEEGDRFTSGASFRFNLFNINFGLGIHF